jgi:hypothetical protein
MLRRSPVMTTASFSPKRRRRWRRHMTADKIGLAVSSASDPAKPSQQMSNEHRDRSTTDCTPALPRRHWAAEAGRRDARQDALRGSDDVAISAAAGAGVEKPAQASLVALRRYIGSTLPRGNIALPIHATHSGLIRSFRNRQKSYPVKPTSATSRRRP